MQILDKSFLVLETLSREYAGLTVSELSRRVDLNISTVHRILSTFAERGYIRQDSDKRYCLTLKFLEISSSYLNGLDLKNVAGPCLKELAAALNQTVFLATLMENQAVYIDRYEQISNLRCYTVLGERKPLYCTALGKSLLLGFSRTELELYIEKCDFAKLSRNTITEVTVLREELDISARRGWTMDDEEAVPGIICYAVPLYDYRGQVIAAASVSLNKGEMVEVDTIVQNLLDVSDLISVKLGYRK